MSVRRIGVLTSGGDAPGMNPCVRGVVRTAMYHGLECYGIRRGWNGLIYRRHRTPGRKERRPHHQPGRHHSLYRPERGVHDRGRPAEGRVHLQVPGSGRHRRHRRRRHLPRRPGPESRYGVNVVGIPGTIDNDIGCTNYCIGFDTAANTAIECIDKLRDTMQSHERCSVVEVMGRNAGYLAMYVGLAVGATAVLIPEEPIDFERDVIEKIRQARFNGFTHYMIVVAEGAGSAADIAQRIKDAIGLDPRVTVLGHIQRGGCPTGRDRVNATKMGYLAVELLAAGKTNRIICTHDGSFTDVDIEDGLAMKKGIQQMEEDVLAAMTGI